MKIVALIGSSRFKDKFHEIGEKLEKQGILPLMMSFFQHADHVSVSSEERGVLRTVDRARIDLCHEAFVINPICRKCGACQNMLVSVMDWEVCQCGCYLLHVPRRPYIGEDTQYEIEYVKSQGKPITYMEPMS